MEKNLIIAIILSIAILITFQVFFSPSPVPIQETQQENQGTISQKTDEFNNKPNSADSFSFNGEIKVNEEKITLETEKLEAVFSTAGGQIKEVKFKQYRTEEGLPLILFSAKQSEPGIGKTFSSRSNIAKNQIWQYEKTEKSINFVFQDGNLKISKKYAFVTPYSLSLNITAANSGVQPKEWQYYMISTSEISKEEALDRRYSSITVSYKNNSKIDNIKPSKIKEGFTEEFSSFDWIAEKNRYFSMVTLPDFKNDSILYIKNNTGFTATAVKSPVSVVYPGQNKTKNYRIYLGPNSLEKLSAFAPGCEKIVDFGIFGPISKVLLKILNIMYLGVKNYGIAIILLTILINIILFPLTRKSYSSMKKMQELQPKINKLKEEHKDNSQKLNQEMINLYRTNGGNPLGGCLPMLLQFPVFLSLYMALTKSIELKGSGFLWINDLALPDSAFILPIQLPFIGNKINLLPILMIIAMFFQQKISQIKSSSQMNSQKQLAVIMPLVFGFIFYHFSSGLVLYWFTNTIITTAIQWKMMGKKG